MLFCSPLQSTQAIFWVDFQPLNLDSRIYANDIYIYIYVFFLQEFRDYDGTICNSWEYDGTDCNFKGNMMELIAIMIR